MADDDWEDCMLAMEEMDGSSLDFDLRFVEHGEELMDYLYHRGRHEQAKESPRPGLILLDLNMPKKDGREAIREIKADPDLRRIPIVVLTTSNAEEDIRISYDLGVNSFIIKPESFEALVESMKTLARYWFKTAELPD